MPAVLDLLFNEWLVGFGVPILIGAGFTLLADEFKEFKAAKTCFIIAAAWAYVKVIMWGLTTPESFKIRVLVFAVVGAVVTVGLGEALRLTSRRQAAQVVEQRFAVEVRSAFVSDSGPLTMFMVTYPSMLGDTASPVLYLAYIQITSLQDVPSTINDFKVAVSKDREGPWEDLVPIHLSTHTLYSLGTPTPYPKVLRMAHGTSRLATPMTNNDMKLAAVIKAEPALESEMTKPIPPHDTIRGWVALDSLRHVGLSPGQIYFLIKVW